MKNLEYEESLIFQRGGVKYKFKRPKDEEMGEKFDLLETRLGSSVDRKNNRYKGTDENLRTIKSIGLADIFREGFYKAAERRKYFALGLMGLAGMGLWAITKFELNSFLETFGPSIGGFCIGDGMASFILADGARRYVDKKLKLN